jgi:hypothetical protein
MALDRAKLRLSDLSPVDDECDFCIIAIGHLFVSFFENERNAGRWLQGVGKKEEDMTLGVTHR